MKKILRKDSSDNKPPPSEPVDSTTLFKNALPSFRLPVSIKTRRFRVYDESLIPVQSSVLDYLSSSAPSFIVGIIGKSNVGKTSLVNLFTYVFFANF
jgi:ribosome biogenesis GTPase A